MAPELVVAAVAFLAAGAVALGWALRRRRPRSLAESLPEVPRVPAEPPERPSLRLRKGARLLPPLRLRRKAQDQEPLSQLPDLQHRAMLACLLQQVQLMAPHDHHMQAELLLRYLRVEAR